MYDFAPPQKLRRVFVVPSSGGGSVSQSEVSLRAVRGALNKLSEVGALNCVSFRTSVGPVHSSYTSSGKLGRDFEGIQHETALER